MSKNDKVDEAQATQMLEMAPFDLDKASDEAVEKALRFIRSLPASALEWFDEQHDKVLPTMWAARLLSGDFVMPAETNRPQRKAA